MLLFRGLSVTFVHCAQTAENIDTISYAYGSLISLSDFLKFGLHPASIPPHILPQSDHPLLI